MSGINLNTSHILLNTSVFFLLLLPPQKICKREKKNTFTQLKDFHAAVGSAWANKKPPDWNNIGSANCECNNMTSEIKAAM